MKRGILLLALLVAASCSKPPESPKVEYFVELPQALSLSSSDFDPIRTAVGEKRIVMMGESIRVTSEFSRVRDRLIRNLHEEADFNLLLFEGSPVEFWIAEEEYLSAKKSSDFSSRDFQRTALFGPWQTDEIRSVLEYALRSQAGVGSSDLYISGYDVQVGQGRRFSGDRNVFEALVDVLRNRDKRISSAEQEAILTLGNLASCQEKKFPESDEQYMQAEQGINALTQVIARVTRNSSNDLHEKMLTLLPKVAGYSLEFCREANEGTRKYTEVRDDWASRQFIDLLTTLNQKALVWAHSQHVRQSQHKEQKTPFGVYVRSAFQDQIFAIHFTAGGGRAIAFQDEQGKEIEPVEKPLLSVEKVSLEKKLSALSSMDFFVASKDLPVEFGAEEKTRLEPDGVMPIDPRKDFDGYYFIQNITAPRLAR